MPPYTRGEVHRVMSGDIGLLLILLQIEREDEMHRTTLQDKREFRFSKTTVLSIAAAMVLAVPQLSSANGLLLNVNFNSDTNGCPPVTGPLATQSRGVGFWDTTYTLYDNSMPDFYATAAANGVSFVVSNSVAGMTNALVVSDAGPVDDELNETTGADVDFSSFGPGTQAKLTRFSFDFSQVQTPSGDNTGYRCDFQVNAFIGSKKAVLMGTSHLHPNDIVLLDPDGSSVTVIGTYTNGVATHVDVITDHRKQTFSVYLNGSLAATSQSFYADGIAPGTVPVGTHYSEFYFQQNAAAVGTNVVALDNIQYYAIPGGSAMALW